MSRATRRKRTRKHRRTNKQVLRFGKRAKRLHVKVSGRTGGVQQKRHISLASAIKKHGRSQASAPKITRYAINGFTCGWL